MIYPTFEIAIAAIREKFLRISQVVRTEKWQGIPLEHDMKEALNISFQCFMTPNLEELRNEIKPNLPWADLHFQERVGKVALNPGETYKVWPYYRMDKEMRTEGEKFSHTYMERIWPGNLHGIRYRYGSLEDLVGLLHREPFTRQAFLPIWFPEDTGVVHGGRVPCTLGYHFIRRDNYLHVVYYIRSCDYLRHFRDDIYLAVLKVLWLIEVLQAKDYFNEGLIKPKWDNVKPGIFTMHITSLHCFVSDTYAINKEIKNENK